MIGPLKIIVSIVALALVFFFLVTLSTSAAEAGSQAGPSRDAMPSSHEWLMVVLLFALAIALHQFRITHHH